MIYSTDRKLALSGWLKEKNINSYNNSLKLQKFLFFYEMFSKADGEKAELSHLRGYKQGPVFSTVFGDYTHERSEFDAEAEKQYNKYSKTINEERAKKVNFLDSVLTEKELSDLTHQMNIWHAKKAQIEQGIRQVSLSEDDYTADDQALINTLQSMYSIEMIDDSAIFNIGEHSFVMSKHDAAALTDIQYDTLWMLACENDLQNPTFISIDEEGRLLVD